MYRTLISLLLCASAALSAPQQNSNITYVKRQLDLGSSEPELKPVQRESRIEKVPLTIPGYNDRETTENVNKQNERTNNSQPTYNYSDRIYSIKTKPKINTSTETNIANEQTYETNSNITEDVVHPEIKSSDILPAESILNDRIATNDDPGLNPEADATQSDEFVTEKYEEETTATTVANEETTKTPTPRQLPKLSYFGKSTAGSFSQNLIAHPLSKRRFRSRCRCEKIWNCAKLQISVPRCPEEEFMCCA